MGKFTTTLAIGAIAILALTGCSGGTPAEDPPGPAEELPAAETEDGAGSPTECLIDRTWNVDVDDLAGQMLTQMQALGSPATSVTGTGSMTIMFAEETLVNTVVDLTFVMVLPMEDGPTMTVTQHQYGSGYGSWFWDGGTPNLVVFEDWVGEYEIDMTMAMEGVAVESAIDLPSSAAGGTDMTVTCIGDTLTTGPEGSPFIQIWDAS
ncbi:MAG TPA: hypothetical protein VFT01_06675 [Homoserinimonas sp.]|nr:hypothetical protein [Homoserinimonas sp.]